MFEELLNSINGSMNLLMGGKKTAKKPVAKKTAKKPVAKKTAKKPVAKKGMKKGGCDTCGGKNQ